MAGTARYGFLHRGRFPAGAAPMVTSSGMAAQGTTLPSPPSFPGARRLPAQRLDHQGRRLGPGEVLLTGDEVAVADGEAPPGAGLEVVRAGGLQRILDAPGHDVPVARQEV